MEHLLSEIPSSWPQAAWMLIGLAYFVWRDRRKDQADAERERRKAEIEARRDAQLREVHEQTVNTHPPDRNLRDDVDKTIGLGESAAASGAVTVRMLGDFRDEVRAGFRRIERDIGGIREEIRTERTERIEGDRRRGER